MNAADLKETFVKRFGKNEWPVSIVRAGMPCHLLGFPDCKGSLLLSCALSLKTSLAARQTGNSHLHLETTTSNLRLDASLSKPDHFPIEDFGKTPFEKMDEMLKAGEKLCGAEFLYDNAIPNFADSEKCIAAATVLMMLSLNDSSLSPKEAVHRFACPYCFPAYLAEKKKAYIISQDNFSYEAVDFQLTGYKIILASYGVSPRSSLRSRNAQQGFALLKQSIPHLSAPEDMTLDEFNEHRKALPDFEQQKAVAQVISENERVRMAKTALESGNLTQLGQLMNLSQQALERYSERSNKKAVTLAESAASINGVLGVRMLDSVNGVISIVADDAVDEFVATVTTEFEQSVGYVPSFFITTTQSSGLEQVLTAEKQNN
jgi:hypothetical protein